MKILEFKIYYEPEIAAGIALDANTAEDLAKKGHYIYLFVPTPSRGICKGALKNIPKYESKYDGHLNIYRYRMFKERKSLLLRLLRYLLCSIKQLFIGSRIKDIDLIFAGSTPPFQGLICSKIKKKKKVPFVYNCQDIFPDSMLSAGITKENSIIYKIGNRIANKTYLVADKIIVPSLDMKENLVTKGVDENKIYVVGNWVDDSIVYPIPRSANKLICELNVDINSFIVVYAGNFGYAQAIDTIVNAAYRLRDKKEITFMLFGRGAAKEKIADKINKLGLKNINLYPLYPYERTSEVYSIGDACIVSCKKGTGTNAMPSKTWSIMACERAILGSFDEGTELEKLIIREQCGLFSAAENDENLANNILTLYNNRNFCKRLGENGRKYILSNLTRSSSTTKIESILNDAFAKK